MKDPLLKFLRKRDRQAAFEAVVPPEAVPEATPLVRPLLPELEEVSRKHRRGSLKATTSLVTHLAIDPPRALRGEPGVMDLLATLSERGLLVMLARQAPPGGRELTYLYRRNGLNPVVAEEIETLPMCRVSLVSTINAQPPNPGRD